MERPNLTGKVNGDVDWAIRRLYEGLEALRQRVDAAPAATNGTQLTVQQTNNITSMGGGPPTPGSTGPIIEASHYITATADATAINSAIAAVPASGGAVHMDSRTWSIDTPVNIHRNNVILFGDGASTLLQAGGTHPTHLIDINGDFNSLESFKVDGNQLTTTKLLRGVSGDFANDPMHTLLTNGTSIYLAPGSNGTWIYDIELCNTKGYAILLDATNTADIIGCDIKECFLHDNIQYTFVETAGQQADSTESGYGSWCGGIHWQGDNGYRVRNLDIESIRIENQYGNAIWSHSKSYNLTNSVFHENIKITGCYGHDFGLDAVLNQVSKNVTVSDCIFDRVGYIANNPKWPAGSNNFAVGIDNGGVVWILNCTGNTVTSYNGEACDADGVYDSTISNNNFVNPLSTDPLYTTNDLAHFGPSRTGPLGKGINLFNTFDPRGAQRNTIRGNNIVNAGYNAINIVNGISNDVGGNNIYHVPVSGGSTPIFLMQVTTMSNWSSGTGLCTANSIHHNRIQYTGASWGIYDDASVTGSNWVWGNDVWGSGNYGEVKFNNTGNFSKTAMTFSTNDRSTVGLDQTIMQREAGNITRFYDNLGGTVVPKASIYRNGLMMLGSGSVNSGALTTGNRATAQSDSVGTSYLYMNQLGVQIGTVPPPAADYGVIYYDKNAGKFKVNENNTGWVNLLGSGTGLPSAPVNSVQFNNAGGFGGDSNMTWDNVNKALSAFSVIVGGTAFNQLKIPTGGAQMLSLQATSTTSANAIDATGGGAGTTNTDWGGVRCYQLAFPERGDVPPVSGSGGCRLYADGNTHTLKMSQNGGPWTAIGGGGISGLTAGRVPYASSSTTLADDNTFTYDSVGDVLTSKNLVLTNTVYNTLSIPSTSGGVSAGLIQATSSLGNCIDATGGGTGATNADWGGVKSYLYILPERTDIPPLSGAGGCRLYSDGNTHTIKVSQNGGAWTTLGGGGSPGGTTGYVQFNNGSGGFGGNGNFVWDNTNAWLNLNLLRITSQAFNAVDVTVGGAGGASADWGGITTYQLAFGGRTTAPPVSGAGGCRFYNDSNAFVFKKSQNAGTWNVMVVISGGIGFTAGRIPFAASTTPDALTDSANLTFSVATGQLTINSSLSSALNITSGGGINCGTMTLSSTASNSLQLSGGMTCGGITCQTLSLLSTASNALSMSGGAQMVSLRTTSTNAYNAVDTTVGGTGTANTDWGGVNCYQFAMPERGDTPPVSGAGGCRLYARSTNHLLMWSQNGGAWVALLTANQTDGSGNWAGGVNTAAGGVTAGGGFSVDATHNGQTYLIHFTSGNFQVNGSGTFTNIQFTKGIITSVS